MSAEIEAVNAKAEAAKVTSVSLAQKRTRIAAEAEQILKSEIISELISRIADHATNCEQTPDKLGVSLGSGMLKVQLRGSAIPYEAFVQSKWDIAGAAAISVRQTDPRYDWSASLWFGRINQSTDYRWYEVSYYTSGLVARSREFEPYHLFNDLRKADEAAAPIMTVENIAQGPLPIDGDHLEDFLDRWISRFAKACSGQLSHPRSLPIK